MDDITSIADLFDQLGALKGPIGWIALCTFAAIRLYRLPEWQPSLPAAARWENLSGLVRYGIIAGLSGLGAGLAAGANGLGWAEALTAGVLAALTAITTNKLVKPQHVTVVRTMETPALTAQLAQAQQEPPRAPGVTP